MRHRCNSHARAGSIRARRCSRPPRAAASPTRCRRPSAADASASQLAQAASPQAIARISPQAAEYQAGARGVRRGRRRLLEPDLPRSGAAATPSGAIGSRSTLDDYVLTQPPVYTGPKRPVNPEPEPRSRAARRKADSGGRRSLQAAARAIPVHAAAAGQRSRIQARLCARTRSAAGLTREQAVRVYSFETGGNGNYDMQSGIEHAPGTRAISTAIGYNQLLTTNSVELLAEQGHEFIQRADGKAARLSGAARKAMEHKIAVLKRMVAFARRCRTTGGAREDRRHAAGLGDACDGAGHRCRPDAADPQAADLGASSPAPRATPGRSPPPNSR